MLGPMIKSDEFFNSEKYYTIENDEIKNSS